MRLKSLIITIMALFVIANVIVAAMQRCGVVPDGVSDAPDGAGGIGAEAQQLRADPTEVTAAVEESPPAVAAMAGPSVGIEGLHLQLSRPLMFDVGTLGGLAADEGHLYVAAWDAGAGAAMLYQVHADSYTIVQVRALREEGVIAVGGIDAGPDRIWVPLIRGGEEPATLVLGVDVATLEVRERFEVAAAITALAAGDDGYVYGVSRDGALWIEWRPDGTPVREVAVAGGVRYADLAHARGSLLAAGSDGIDGVLDVLDPQGFTLLARHRSDAGEADGPWVTAGGLEVRGEAILLLPAGGARPSLLTYVPKGGDLGAFVPSVEGGGR